MNLIELLAYVQDILFKCEYRHIAHLEITTFLKETGVAPRVQEDILDSIDWEGKRFNGLTIPGDDTTPRGFRIRLLDRSKPVPLSVIIEAIKGAAPADAMKDDRRWCNGCDSAREVIARRIREYLAEDEEFNLSQFSVDCGVPD